MINLQHTPDTSYGILRQNHNSNEIESIAEQVRILGFSTLPSGLSSAQIKLLSEKFDSVHTDYQEKHGKNFLIKIDEENSIRCPFLYDFSTFLRIALNKKLLSLVGELIQGKFILNQQNGVINPPLKKYNQGAWHRDLPYQHFVSSQPIAINALYCIDDFTEHNGATFVLPASHKCEELPSNEFIQKNAMQIAAKAGTFIILDCMTFHSGGLNTTNTSRKAINHVFTIPYLKQQIQIPTNLKSYKLSSKEKDILGFHNKEPQSVEKYLFERQQKYAAQKRRK